MARPGIGRIARTDRRRQRPVAALRSGNEYVCSVRAGTPVFSAKTRCSELIAATGIRSRVSTKGRRGCSVSFTAWFVVISA